MIGRILRFMMHQRTMSSNDTDILIFEDEDFFILPPFDDFIGRLNVLTLGKLLSVGSLCLTN